MSLLSAPSPEDLVGRTVMLKDPSRPFQCPGFSLGRNNLQGVVPDPASNYQIQHGLSKIQQALLDGRLVDITDQHIKGFSLSGSGHSPASVEDTEGKVYITVGRGGSLAIISPKNKSEAIEMDKQLAEKGLILPADFKVAERPLEMVAGVVAPGKTGELIHNLEEKIDEIRRKVTQ